MLANISFSHSTHWNGDVDSEVTVVCEKLGDASVENEAVAVENGGGDALVDAARCGLPS